MAEQAVFKNHRGKAIRSGQKLMAYNVYVENIANKSKSQAVKQTAPQVGVGERIMWNIIKETETSGFASSPRSTRKCTSKYISNL